MANSYETITLLQNIPARLLTRSDHWFLEAMGWSSAKENEEFYLYSEHGPSLLAEVEYTSAELLQLAIDYPEEEQRPEWVKMMLAEDAAGIVERELGWIGVLQGLLNKPENTGPQGLDFLEGKAGYWCDKARPHEFGGWCFRMTRTDVWIAGVDDLLEEMAAKDAHARAQREQRQGQPFVLNEPGRPDQPFYEVIVTRDVTESCVVGVYADDEGQAASLATAPELLEKAPFDLDEGNTPHVYLGDPEGIEQIEPPAA